ncbi:MAG: LysR substrate-binding domain-containing protein [Candidatus Dechloromonas phosphoritropha]
MTAAGEELLLTVRDFDDAWNRLESATDDLKSFKRGKLRVGLVTTAKHALPHMLGDLFWHSPEIDIELEIANRQRIVERLFGNQDDLGVMSYPPANLDIVSQPFLDNEYVVLAPAAHWAVGKALRLQELATEHFLLREEGSGSRHVIDPHMRDTGIQLKVRLSPASDKAIRELVASGNGPDRALAPGARRQAWARWPRYFGYLRFPTQSSMERRSPAWQDPFFAGNGLSR